MHNPAFGEPGIIRVDCAKAAASRTAPAEVIHDRCGLGERKKARIEKVVCVSDSSENHDSHSAQRCGTPWSQPMAWYRMSSATASGGVPARAASRATATSRRENAP